MELLFLFLAAWLAIGAVLVLFNIQAPEFREWAALQQRRLPPAIWGFVLLAVLVLGSLKAPFWIAWSVVRRLGLRRSAEAPRKDGHPRPPR